MTPLSVNDVIDRILALDGDTLFVVGVLSLEFEGHCIDHIPKWQRRNGYSSSIWLNIGNELSIPDIDQLSRFDGRHVVIEGFVSAPDPQFGGCGHFSLWPAEISVIGINKP